MTKTLKGITGLFAALAVTTALVATPQQAEASQPTSQCDTSQIFARYSTNQYSSSQKAFGNDGCVYSVIQGNPLATKNYDILNNARDAQQFVNEHDNAERMHNNIIANQQRQYDNQQRIADNQRRNNQRQCTNALSNVGRQVLNGGRINLGNILYQGQYCLRR